MKNILPLTAALAALLISAAPAWSHCEVPCGIYDDALRAKLIDEHITTIEKAMKQIDGLSEADPKVHNQITRWIINKEKHATELQHIVTQYFLTQRIKPVDPKDSAKFKKYLRELTLLHHLLVYAMKAKQSTDQGHIKTLRKLSTEFQASYFGKKGATGVLAPGAKHAHANSR